MFYQPTAFKEGVIKRIFSGQSLLVSWPLLLLFAYKYMYLRFLPILYLSFILFQFIASVMEVTQVPAFSMFVIPQPANQILHLKPNYKVNTNMTIFFINIFLSETLAGLSEVFSPVTKNCVVRRLENSIRIRQKAN